MSASLFSRRLGYVPAPENRVRENLSDDLRQPIIDILRRFAGKAYLQERIQQVFNPYGFDSVPRRVGPVALSDDEKAADFEDVKRVLLECEWFRLYDLIEVVFAGLEFHDSELADLRFEEARAPVMKVELNDYFVHAGIDWQLVDGRITTRGDEVFEETVASARTVLTSAGRKTAADHMTRAVEALSLRPTANAAGAIYHATAALEAVARSVADDSKATLGDVLKRHPGLVPKPLDEALSKVWGYASNEARHAKEGHEPSVDEATLVVALAAACVTYLSRKAAGQ